MSQNQAAVPAYLQPIVCGVGDDAVTVYPLDVRTSVAFCREADGNFTGGLRTHGSFVVFGAPHSEKRSPD
jgi:hypothetical protein